MAICLTMNLSQTLLFWDLDANVNLVIHDTQIASVFYRGAAPKRPDGLLDTAVCIGGGEILIFDDRALFNTGKSQIRAINLLKEDLEPVFGDLIAVSKQ